jgi:hypothetical protein
LLLATIPFIVDGYDSARSRRARGKIPKKKLMANDLDPVGGFSKIFNIICGRTNHSTNSNQQENDKGKKQRQNELKKEDILRFCEELPANMKTCCMSMKELKVCAQKQVAVQCQCSHLVVSIKRIL